MCKGPEVRGEMNHLGHCNQAGEEQSMLGESHVAGRVLTVMLAEIKLGEGRWNFRWEQWKCWGTPKTLSGWMKARFTGDGSWVGGM